MQIIDDEIRDAVRKLAFDALKNEGDAMSGVIDISDETSPAALKRLPAFGVSVIRSGAQPLSQGSQRQYIDLQIVVSLWRAGNENVTDDLQKLVVVLSDAFNKSNRLDERVLSLQMSGYDLDLAQGEKRIARIDFGFQSKAIANG